MLKAYVLLSCEHGATTKIINQLKHLHSVKDVQGTYGQYDIVATIESDRIESQNQIVSQQIRKIDKIRSTLTLVDKNYNDDLKCLA